MSSGALKSAKPYNASVCLACAERFRVHFKVELGSDAKYLIPPETFASLLMVRSPR